MKAFVAAIIGLLLLVSAGAAASTPDAVLSRNENGILAKQGEQKEAQPLEFGMCIARQVDDHNMSLTVTTLHDGGDNGNVIPLNGTLIIVARDCRSCMSFIELAL